MTTTTLALPSPPTNGKNVQRLKVDLACGQNKQPGFYGVDCVPLPGVDKVHDLSKRPWPFKANSVDEVFISHYLEHVEDLFGFFDELYRILKPGAKATIIAPYYTSMRCWQDPTHKQAICEAKFLYANAQWRRDNKLDHYSIRADFDFTFGYALDPAWATRHQEAQQFAIKHYWNVVQDLHVTLTKRDPHGDA